MRDVCLEGGRGSRRKISMGSRGDEARGPWRRGRESERVGEQPRGELGDAERRSRGTCGALVDPGRRSGASVHMAGFEGRLVRGVWASSTQC